MGNRPTANRQKSEKKLTKNRAKIRRKSMKNRSETVPGDPRSSSEATGAQKSRKKTRKSRFWEPPGDAQEAQNSSKNVKKNGQKRSLPKMVFFRILGAFWAFRHRFSSILGPKMDARTIVFSRFFGIVFSHHFFVIFVAKKKKHKK